MSTNETERIFALFPFGNAANQLELTERKTQRLMNRFSESYAARLVSLRGGKPGNHRFPETKCNLMRVNVRHNYGRL